MGIAVFGCSNAQRPYGVWKNGERTIVITDSDTFQILYGDTAEIKGFRGRADIDKNVLSLSFEEYLYKDGRWYSVAGTDLENHVEQLSFLVSKDTLRTYIQNTEKQYVYERVAETCLQ
ncbi:hypothetical protein [Treponema brennaborense]|nr:hypothetical protein [Treponema brennaborense]